ncbi:MAG: tRNA pseudouridine(13) synthase TruD [Candidatus Woesearchaeota archaeon]
MYKIKTLPEDFVVTEVLSLRLEKGPYSYYLLTKRCLNTLDAIRIVSEKIGVSEKLINFAGIKDKDAVTHQYISIKGGPKKDFHFGRIHLAYLGDGGERLSIGCLEGNHFDIKVRNIKTIPKKIKRFVNFFDEQRFGVQRRNPFIGRMLLKREFKAVISELADKGANEHISKNPNDFLGAIRKVQKWKLQLYLHSYQSFLWNLAAVEYLRNSRNKTKKNMYNIDIVIPGFGMNLDGEEGAAVAKVLSQQKITEAEFILRELPELLLEAGKRKLFAEVQNLSIGELEPDELHPGMKKIKLSFFLSRGSYATMAVKHMFNSIEHFVPSNYDVQV